MSKFKVGDKVRILDGSKIENYTGNWDGLMKEYIGEVHTIRSVDCDWNNGRVSYCFNDLLFVWDERGLELVSEKKQKSEQKQKIVITTHGRITKARLYEDEKLVRQAVARCAPDDKFDFNVGAGLAFTRLIGTSPIATSLDQDKFAHGKLAVKVNKKTYDAFIKQCYQRGFTWHNGDKVNIWKVYDELPPLLKGIIECATATSGEHIYISAADGELKWYDKRREDLEEEEYEFI